MCIKCRCKKWQGRKTQSLSLGFYKTISDRRALSLEKHTFNEDHGVDILSVMTDGYMHFTYFSNVFFCEWVVLDGRFVTIG